MPTFSGRVEAKIVVPSGGAAVSATNSGGGPTTVTTAAGNYYWTQAGGVSSLATVFQSQLNSTRAPAYGSWSVAVSTSTGLATIDCPSGAVVTKTGGSGFAWDAGVSSTQSISGDGYIEFTASETAKSRKIGFATAAIGVDHTLIKWGLYLKSDNIIYTTELGVETSTGVSYAGGETLTIKRTGTTVTYLKNGTVIATSGTSSTGSLVVGVAALSSSATVRAIRLYSAGVRSALTLSASSSNVTVTATTYSITWTSTQLRDVFGFTGDISAADSPQTATTQVEGMFFPDSPINLDGDPYQAPIVSDLRTSQSPTGVVLGLVGNTFRRHRGVVWPWVPRDRAWESAVTYANASWEHFFQETQMGLGSTFFVPSSPVQIYWSNAGTDTLLGGAYNSGTGVSGWSIVGVPSVEPKKTNGQWTGLWRIELPELVSAG